MPAAARAQLRAAARADNAARASTLDRPREQDFYDCQYGGCFGFVGACCGGVWRLVPRICILPV